MIVLKDNDRFRIIFQRAHAQLAASIASSIAPEFYPEKIPFSHLHTAIADHDDGRRNWEGKLHLNEMGFPMDYKEQPLNLQLEQATKTVEIAIYKSPWIGLLISMHQVSLYEPFSEDNEAVCGFINAQLEIQNKSRKILHIDEEKAHAAYDFMRFCDELSLILCEEKLLSGIGSIKPGKIKNSDIHLSYNKTTDTYSCQPWCFKDERVKMSLYSYPVRFRQFKDDHDLVNELNGSSPILNTWNFLLH